MPKNIMFHVEQHNYLKKLTISTNLGLKSEKGDETPFKGGTAML